MVVVMPPVMVLLLSSIALMRVRGGRAVERVDRPITRALQRIGGCALDAGDASLSEKRS